MSHTTRSPRPGELHGREYFYVKDIDSMRRAIENGGFLEHATVHGNLYGTSIESVEVVTDSGKVINKEVIFCVFAFFKMI